MTIKPNFRKLTEPLSMASYLAWLAVWYGNSYWLDRAPGNHWQAEPLMLIFLATWLWNLVTESPPDDWQSRTQLSVLVLSSLCLIALGRSGSSPILMVLAVCQFAGRLPVRSSAVLLVTINAIYFLLMLRVWQYSVSNAVINLAAFGAFQLFAFLVLHYAREVEIKAAELARVNADLLATRSLLAQTARDQERLRLSRELHDVAGHKLTALRMNLRALSQQAGQDDGRSLASADALAGELLDDLRAVVRQLRAGDGVDLEKGIRQLAAPLNGLTLDIAIDRAIQVDRVIEAETLLRVVQEGLTNAVRHGRASSVQLGLRQDGDHLRLTLEDNGRVKWPIEPGIGLKGMRERIELLDGELKLNRAPGGGLRIDVSLPIEGLA